MKVGDIFPSEFLKSSDIGGIAAAKRVRVTIADVKPWEDQQGNRKLSIGFARSKKRLLANVTNARTIAKAYGEETEGWRGRDIILYVQMVDFRGQQTEALRIMIPQPAPAVQPAFQGGAYQPPPPQQAPVAPSQRPQQPAYDERNPPPVDAFGLPADAVANDLDDEIPF